APAAPLDLREQLAQVPEVAGLAALDAGEPVDRREHAPAPRAGAGPPERVARRRDPERLAVRARGAPVNGVVAELVERDPRVPDAVHDTARPRVLAGRQLEQPAARKGGAADHAERGEVRAGDIVADRPVP